MPMFMSVTALCVQMLLATVIFVGIWWLYYRPRSLFNRRPSYVSLKGIDGTQPFDYIVVGGGPGGLGAARALIESSESASDTPSVLLLDMGAETLPSSTAGALLNSSRRDRLLMFASNLITIPALTLPGYEAKSIRRSMIDNALTVQRPLRTLPTLDETAASPRDRARWMGEAVRTYTPYPRGSGIGGTAQLDWGLHMLSSFEPHSNNDATSVGGDGAAVPPTANTRPWWRLQPRFALVRSPLSWAFADSAAEVVGSKHMATQDEPYKTQSVFPAYLRLDVDGRRLPLASALLDGVSAERLRRLHVLPNCIATGMLSDEAPLGDAGVRICAVVCRMFGSKETVPIPLRRGVVVAGGAIHTPNLLFSFLSQKKLLQRPLLTTRTVQLRDALALPLLFKAHSGVSSDPCNDRTARAHAQWWLSQRGPFLMPITDTVASIALPELGPCTELTVFLLPFGGRDPSRFYTMGWDRVLGSYQEALTMVMVLKGVEGLTFSLDLGAPSATTLASATPPSQREAATVRAMMWKRGCGQVAPFCRSTALTEETSETIRAAFISGIRKCREIVSTAPLCHLSPGSEAVDFALLKEDPTKAIQLARLVHTPFMKLSKQHQAELIEYSAWASEIAKTEKYMSSYVDAHAYWFGTGSGSSEVFLDKASANSVNFKVAGLDNVVVGDCSSVTEYVWKQTGNMDNLMAGSVATTVDAGRLAATQLTREVSK